MTGWITPRAAIEAASSSSAASSKWRRGWSGWGSIDGDRQGWRALSPLTLASAPAATSGSSRRVSPEQRAQAAAERRRLALGRAPAAAAAPRCESTVVVAHAAFLPLRQAADQLARERHIGAAAGAGVIVDQRRQAMARRFGQADVARNDRFEHQRAEARADIVGDLVGQAVAAVEHGQRDADDAELGIEALLDALDRLQQLAQSFEREEFALQRHQQRIGRGQRIERQQAERRRAIDEADVVTGVRLPEPCAGGRCGLRPPTSSISAPDRSTVAGTQVEPGNTCRDHAVASGAWSISTS